MADTIMKNSTVAAAVISNGNESLPTIGSETLVTIEIEVDPSGSNGLTAAQVQALIDASQVTAPTTDDGIKIIGGLASLDIGTLQKAP